MLQLWSYHVSKVVHAEAVGMFAHGVLQIVHLYLLQVLLPHHSPPALLLLKKTKHNSDFFLYYLHLAKPAGKVEKHYITS